MVKQINPDPGKVKINMNGSYTNNGDGIGGIVKDEDNNMIMAFAAKVNSNSNSKPEAKTAKYGIQWCSQHGFNKCIMELDSLIIIEMIKNRGTNNLKIRDTIEDIFY
ncbi:hypothetical protein HAX54_011416 [Datura stramonium]|uniref:RNase H type-1 domain-containing protein n=1 Tax=Datura stramonium TaxID=4076 RepID=A0ABS8THZ5_DATST|nr:hypothetical protein [Datura stramonium]